MAFIDYYKILGVDKNIPQKDVRAAYRRRAKQFHPDLHPDDPKAKAKFQALNEAYEVIGDPEKRKKYDQYGEHWKEADAYNQATGGGTEFHWTSGDGSPFEGFDFNGFSSGHHFSSFFEDLFGNMGGYTRSTASQNTGQMDTKVNIDLYTALLGGQIILSLNNGHRIKLTVKPGTQNGTKVRLRGKGRLRSDGTYGDLILTYNVLLPTNLSERQRQLLMQMRDA